jgi:acetylornithine deacetylase
MNNNTTQTLQQAAVKLLQDLIAIPSFSKEEDRTATIICNFLQSEGVEYERAGNNVFARNKYFEEGKPVILLNSHHDTVKPNKGYTLDPFAPTIQDGKLYGLGSNDAGGPLVSLITAFLHFYNRPGMKYNLVLGATAEEEISGPNGVEAMLASPVFLDFVKENNSSPFKNWSGIVGEPTLLRMAVAERGLMVLDCTAHGKAGHAAREEGENAIYKALKDIEWFRSHKFPKVSDLLGPVKMSATVIETENRAHNVVPTNCKFVVDVRVNELYTFEDVLKVIKENITSDVQPRSFRLRSTAIAMDNPLVQAGIAMGKPYYGSPTTSDKALMNFQALKIGPGDSARSHTADEFIYIEEIHNGVEFYIQLLNQVL